jgi:hypothetical protein
MTLSAVPDLATNESPAGYLDLLLLCLRLASLRDRSLGGCEPVLALLEAN